MTRWLDETGGTRGADYDARFRALAAAGVEMHGEAAYVDALLERDSRVLDAGCGTGRVAVELARRGHRVVGVDNDPSMLDVARTHEGPEWILADLATLSLPVRFDLVVAAGNVVVFLAPGSEEQVVSRLAAQVRPGGLLVCGWRTDRLTVPTWDRWALTAGLVPIARHASWQGAPWTPGADWCVAVDRARETAVDRAVDTAADRAGETAVDRAG